MHSVRRLSHRLHRRLRPTSLDTLSLSDLFFTGHFRELTGRYEVDPEAPWSDDDLHWIIAALAATGRGTSEVAARLRRPPSWEEFEKSVRAALQAEQGTGDGSVLHQPQVLRKADFAAYLGLNAGKTHFVETGTYIGVSSYMVSALFEEVWTVEAEPLIFEAAIGLFDGSGTKNIRAHRGDSRSFLAHLPQSVCDHAVFFLDAHFSAGITSRKYGECPVVDEISVILQRSPTALLVVDDLREMTGKQGYPSLSEVLASVPSSCRVEIAFDQLIVRGGADWQ